MPEQKPMCPYCGPWNGYPDGVEMKPLQEKGRDGWPDMNHYICPTCYSGSPIKRDADEAYNAALRRFQPMQKPLTYAELQRQPKPWPIWLEEKDQKETQPIILRKAYRDYISAIGTNGTYGLYCQGTYGKLWRCWLCCPTAEERASAKWEE